MSSIREPETVNPSWTSFFRYECGTVALGGSFLAFILIVIWLFMSPFDGLGARVSSGVTITYFNWHPFLMASAFLVFMIPAILSFEIFPFARHTNKSIHGFLNLLSLLAAIAGFAIVLDCHNNLSTTGSFHTVHGCIGLVVVILLALQYFGGFILYGIQLAAPAYRGSLKPLHKRLGFAIVLLGVANITLGIFEQELKKNLKGSIHQLSNAIGVICAVTFVAIIFSIAKFVDKRDDDYQLIVDNTNANTNNQNYGTENNPL